jgi:hypothetical protein
MNIDPVHLAFRSTAEGAQKILHELEAELAEARARRDKILIDLEKASAAAVRDQRERLKLPALNKSNVEAGRLIVSIERQVSEAKKRLAMSENHAAGAAAKRAESEDAALIRDKWFAVSCPDGRAVRHRGASLESLQRALQPGYRVIGQAFGTNEDGTDGIVADRHSDMMQAMLDAYGDTLLAWLTERGIVGADKTVVILPSNNREKMQ